MKTAFAVRAYVYVCVRACVALLRSRRLTFGQTFCSVGSYATPAI